MRIRSLLLLLLVSLNSYAADCSNAAIEPSTDETVDFELRSDGTLVDRSTGLMWMRCSIGQTWVTASNHCTGNSVHAGWEQMILINNFNSAGGFAGKKDWRLPNINELRSIVEDCRSNPAINTLLFPQTPNTQYWTASSYSGLATHAWTVDFAQGRDNYDLKSNSHAIRLVRVAD